MEEAEDGLPQASGRLRLQPQATSVIVVCTIIVTAIAIVFVLINLSGVLVPLTFAVFLTFLVEPILSMIVLAPNMVARVWRRARRRARRDTLIRGDIETEAAPFSARIVSPSPMREALQAATGSESEAGIHVDIIDPTVLARGNTCSWIIVLLQRTWDAISVILCVIVLLGIIASVGLGVYGALCNVNWDKYKNSPKLKDIEEYLDKLGITKDIMSDGNIFSLFKSDVMQMALKVLDVAESIILTLLMFFFCLVATLPGIHTRSRNSRVKTLMQRYLLCKTVSSLIIALAVMLALDILKVDLVAVFGLLTFALNFIPNVGSFLAMFAPVPLVFLDPNTALEDTVLVVLVPFLIHNTLGCIVEPKLMADGLDLHPLTVVVALTFWGSVWGVTGAVLSVPLTCALRLGIEEIDHPHARVIHAIFDVPFGSRSRKAPTPRNHGNSVVSARTPTASQTTSLRTPTASMVRGSLLLPERAVRQEEETEQPGPGAQASSASWGAGDVGGKSPQSA